MTAFGFHSWNFSFPMGLELDCGLAHRGSQDQGEDHGKAD